MKLPSFGAYLPPMPILNPLTLQPAQPNTDTSQALRKPTVFHFEKQRPRHVGHNAVHRSISAGDLMTWWDNHPYKVGPLPVITEFITPRNKGYN